ncbi:hypothetical protein G7Y79_00079g100330 [Physcia stellaris]|nr:hypothetical protein G7Y79_00079g100330 [Physcia stellaris]
MRNRHQPVLALILLLLSVLNAAQSVTINDFPPCAQKCITTSLAQTGGHSTSDLDFICSSNQFLSAAEGCEAQSCPSEELIRIFGLAIQLCEPVGGTAHIGLFNLSSCAQPALTLATQKSGCKPTNWTCICSNPAYTVDAAKAEETACNATERESILQFSSLACAAAGLPLPNITSPLNTTSPSNTTTGSNMTVTSPSVGSPSMTAFTGGAAPVGIGGGVLAVALGMMGFHHAPNPPLTPNLNVPIISQYPSHSISTSSNSKIRKTSQRETYLTCELPQQHSNPRSKMISDAVRWNQMVDIKRMDFEVGALHALFDIPHVHELRARGYRGESRGPGDFAGVGLRGGGAGRVLFVQWFRDGWLGVS